MYVKFVAMNMNMAAVKDTQKTFVTLADKTIEKSF